MGGLAFGVYWKVRAKVPLAPTVTWVGEMSWWLSLMVYVPGGDTDPHKNSSLCLPAVKQD